MLNTKMPDINARNASFNPLRWARYQNRFCDLMKRGVAPRDHDVRQGIGTIIQRALRRGEKVSGRWRGTPVELNPPFLDRRQNPELQGYTPTSLARTAVRIGALIAGLALADLVFRSFLPS